MANIELYSRKADLLPEKKTEPLIEQLRQAFYDAGLEPPTGPIQTDGQIHRFSTGDKPGDDAGWYLIYGDNIPAGVIGNWRTGETHNFRAHVDRRLSLAEEAAIQADIARARKRREEATRIKHEQAAATVAEIWDAAQLASPEHPYLSRKQVQTHGARIASDGRLILPLYNEAGALSSLQYIDATGRKQYHPGGAVGSCFYMMGDTSGSETIYIAEGFATAATICETMHAPTVAAYSANNLPGVTAIMRAKNPLSEIVIVADNDASKTGENYATQAAAKHGARVVLIPAEGQDANDFALAGGDLRGLLGVNKGEWLTSDAELTAQPAPIKWLIRHWLQESAVIMVHGPSTVGKSFQVVDWSLSIAYKKEWNGNKINNGLVAYCAGEGHHGLRARIAVWRQENQIKETGRFFLSKNSKPLDTPGGLQDIISELRALPEKPKLVVIDTLSKFIVELDENSNQDMNFLIRQAELIKDEFDCAVLIVHHTGHGEGTQSRARGGSSIRAGVENEISIRFDGENRIIEQMKVKDAERLPPISFELVSVPICGWFDDEGEQVTSAIVQYGDAKTNKIDKFNKQYEMDNAVVLLMINDAKPEKTEDGRYRIAWAAMKRYVEKNWESLRLSSEKRAGPYLDKSKNSSFLSRALRSGLIEESDEKRFYIV